MGKKPRSRIYLRGERYYGDFRDLGGKREALIPEEETRATTDPDVAAHLASARVKELELRKRNRVLLGVEREAGLAEYAASHLDLKAKDEEATRQWLIQAQRHLETAVAFFGAERNLAAISPEDLKGYVEHLRQRDNGRGGTLTDATVRAYLNSLSNMFRRAVSDRYVQSNPVGDMFTKPTPDRVEADYLEPEEAALLLEAARTYRPPVDPVAQGHGGAIAAHAQPWIYPILATCLLTGGRKSEVLGLEVDDVSFRLGRIYFRSNDWRRLKTRGSKRAVPLWPQLREILEQYMVQREQGGGLGRLLFPSVGGRPRGKEGEDPDPGERMIYTLRRSLDRIGERAGMPKGHVRLHMLRHTYTAARIQTLDRGAPVALYTVARELGHRSTEMIEDRYGHLHDRALAGGSEVVEFRVEHYRAALGDRLDRVRD